MEKFRPSIEMESEIFLPEGWYFDDDFISEIYLKIDNKELSETAIDYMFEEVEEEQRKLLDIGSDKLSGTQLEQVTMLGNVARELYKHSSHYRTAHGKPEHNAIDLGETVH